ncbi:hypothetical protein ILUMI_27058 [Ignelater luminosus]|uniref:Uncharacterized protein n=1 Tax=Ignelater luminosus TaxID=2038154 RepID=A0A8K0C3C2_IGNLU|nr:hypothetical protein ILUMI_27058 [Ignelater luminosus]
MNSLGLLSILLGLCVFYTNVKANCNVEGYYWRDYTGETPADALAGGTDVNGKPIYIGQIFNLRFLIPAKIYENDKTAYYEYGGPEHSIKDNIKILCTQHPEHFKWVRTNNEEIKLMTSGHLVIGGYEPGCTTYIGRVRHAGEILVGKALTDNLPQFAGLYVTKDEKAKKYTTFEVLTFDPNTV